MSRRNAAALLISRGTGREIEVFLGERATELRFFGGYHALPGGTIDDGDGDAELDPAGTMQACARRELFEETGLLWPGATGNPDELGALRQAMLARERQPQASGPRWDDFTADIAFEPMRELCRIETPPFAPVRYDTVFFHVPLARCAGGTAAGEPDVWPGELTSGRFWRPDDALARWRRGEMLLVPPVVILLEHLAEAADLDAFADAIATTAADYHKGRLHQVRFSPGVVLAPLRTPTLPPATTTNCYLLGRDRVFVIDPGSPHADEQRRLLALLDEVGRAGAEIAGILVTHHHPDHIGGVAALSAARDLPVHGHQLTLDRLPEGMIRGQDLEDGATLALGRAPDDSPDWQLTALHTPGHDRGHLCFEESRYGAMIVGDMLSTVSTIIIDPPEGHLATYLDSLERIAQRPISTLYPAHGPAMRDGQRLVRQYVRHRRHREASLLQALDKGEATVEELVVMVYWDADPGLYEFASRSLLAGLEKLAEEGRARQQDGRWSATKT